MPPNYTNLMRSCTFVPALVLALIDRGRQRREGWIVCGGVIEMENRVDRSLAVQSNGGNNARVTST